jgi:hypothetical protein
MITGSIRRQADTGAVRHPDSGTLIPAPDQLAKVSACLF